MAPNAFPQAASIEASLALAADRAGDLTPQVYARMFTQHPEIQPLFCNDRSNAAKGEMLSRAFETILDFIGERHYADHLIRSESMTHDSYGVPPAVFASFFTIVADTVQNILGADWTPETATAWRALLTEIEATTTPEPAI